MLSTNRGRFIAACLGCIAIIVIPDAATAQDSLQSILEEGTLTSRMVQIFALVTVLSIVPGIAIMITCFPFIVTVLAILRQAIGLQQSPPNILIVSLALFLTYFVMDPVFRASWENGLAPVLAGDVALEDAFQAIMSPFREFMGARIDANTYMELAALRPPEPDNATQTGLDNAPLSIMIPSFLLSEIERAFQIGFIIFLPFLIIDLVVAAVLMSMGMMMVPPAIVSLPFKLAFFAVADGWTLIAASLVRGYGM